MSVKDTLILGTGWGDAVTTQALETEAALDSWGRSDLQDWLGSSERMSHGRRERVLQLVGVAGDVSSDDSAPLF